MVAEQGGYDELISRGGVFAQLNRIQYQTDSVHAAASAA